MLRNRLALLAILISTLGACGGRSSLRTTVDGGPEEDGRSLTDAKADVRTDAGAADSARNDGTADRGPDMGSGDGRPDAPTDARRDVPADAARDGARDALADAGRDAPDAAPVLASIELTPPNPTIVVGVPYNTLVVTALMTDGTTSNVTTSATFTSSDPATVRVSGRTLNGIKAGSATITATYQGKTATSRVTVTTSPLQSISIDGVAPVPVGQFILVTATGILADGTKLDITGAATWASSDATVATVALDGTSGKARVNGIKAGAVSITATLSGMTDKVTVTVTSAAMTRIDITPAQPILQRGISQAFQATATYDDGTTGDVTLQAKWLSSNLTVASITIDSAQVLLRALAAGTTTLTAALNNVSGTTTVTVTAPTLVTITVAPNAWSANVGGTQSFTATGTYSDQSTADITVSATWSSSDASIVSVSNASGAKGQAAALAVGGVEIRATLSGVSGTAAVKVSASPLVSIAIKPDPLALVLGLSGALTATGTYQNGLTQDLTSQVAWSVSDPTIATISNAAGSAGRVTSVSVGTTGVVAILGSVAAKALVTVSQAKLTGITVTPSTASITAGSKQQFTATGTYDNGSTPDLTSQVTWSSGDITVAQVSNAAGSKGLATSLVAGRTTITATLGAISGAAGLSVTAPQLSSIMISPTSASIEVGATQAFTVTAVYQNGTTAAVTGTWTSSDTAVATIQATGASRRAVATGVAPGTSTITVTYQGLTDTALLTVTAVPTLVGLTITPVASPSILVGATQTFQANAVFSNGSTTVVTATANWTSSDAKVASVSNGGGGGGGGPGGGRGVATGVGAGTATITATYRGFTATATITVRAPSPIGLIVTPAAAQVMVNGTQQFAAMVTLEDGTTQTVTSTASWTTSNGAIASISTGGGGPFGGGGRGVATGLAAGTVTITATYSGLSATASLTVSAATPTKLVVTPPAPSIHVGQTQPFVATLVYSDNTTAIVTGQTTWSSSNPSVATISTPGGGPGPGGGGAGGTATGLEKGSTTITATYSGLSATATLTVTDPPVAFVQVTPTNPSIPVQGTQQFTATAVFADNTTRNVTALATWSSSSASVAVVANSGGTIGRATALAEGTSTIAATYQGMSGTSLLTVAASVQSITVTPVNPTTVPGLPVGFVATALLSNNTTLVVTGSASWVSSDATVATVTAAGVATPIKAGTTTITATYLGKSGTSTLTVAAGTLSSIAITPAPVSLAAGASQQLTATGTYSDGTARDITSAATWLSSAPAVATVSNAAGSRGLVTALASGSANVTATFQGITSAAGAVTVP